MPHRTDPALHPHAQEVLALLREHGTRRAATLAQDTGLSRPAVYISLHVLQERGLVTNPARGLWRSAVPAGDPLPKALALPAPFRWLEYQIAQLAFVARDMDDGDPIGVELTLAKHHLAAALERARG